MLRANGLYTAMSDDGGYTWTTPKKIEDFGVDPAVCVLGCGAILTTYGRPGFLVRPCFDGRGEKWEDPIEDNFNRKQRLQNERSVKSGQCRRMGDMLLFRYCPLLSDNEGAYRIYRSSLFRMRTA